MKDIFGKGGGFKAEKQKAKNKEKIDDKSQISALLIINRNIRGRPSSESLLKNKKLQLSDMAAMV